MPPAIRTLDDSNLTIGTAGFGLRDNKPGSPKQEVHDGDTIVVHTAGNLSVRFLAIDTPEVSFTLPNDKRFRDIGSPEWSEFLDDPFAEKWPAFEKELSQGLRMYLQPKVGKGCAANHAKHAKIAHQYLVGLVESDMAALGQTKESFQFFLAFAFEVMDGYGRLLAYINREQKDRDKPSPRPRTYNERQLQAGVASPFFIWPNISPWKKADSVSQAVIPPGQAKDLAAEDVALDVARKFVRDNRRKHEGIYSMMDPLMLEPFELRYLSRRRPPSRWVIDLSRNDSDLVPPQAYYQIPNPEDRLYIPSEYVPLFVEKGWKRG